MSGYELKFSQSIKPQNEADLSFIGGYPLLPTSMTIPRCTLCSSEETFFFQVAFPQNHPFVDKTLAVFSCTNCFDEYSIIPKMLDSNLQDAVIPNGFLKSYQTNFSLLIFDTNSAKIQYGYEPKIIFRRWHFMPLSAEKLTSKVGGSPVWQMKEESPSTYQNEPMAFLLQLVPSFKFSIYETAPQQARWIIHPSLDEPRGYYELFASNTLYFFGNTESKDSVYLLTQVSG